MMLGRLDTVRPTQSSVRTPSFRSDDRLKKTSSMNVACSMMAEVTGLISRKTGPLLVDPSAKSILDAQDRSLRAGRNSLTRCPRRSRRQNMARQLRKSRRPGRAVHPIWEGDSRGRRLVKATHHPPEFLNRSCRGDIHVVVLKGAPDGVPVLCRARMCCQPDKPPRIAVRQSSRRTRCIAPNRSGKRRLPRK
ncbi:hypothetical protein ABID62_009418 [Bradyrhizobium sp. S3.9.1]